MATRAGKAGIPAGRLGSGFVLVLAAALAALGFAVAASASAASRAEEREGAETLRAVEDGKRECGELAASEYESIGQYAMGRMVGSPAAHESMDRLMAQMMGERGEQRMHFLMGRRFSGCGGGRLAGGFGGMMGTMGMMGRGFAPGALQGSVGPGGGPDETRFPGMMGGRAFRAENDNDDDGWGTAAIVMTVSMLLLLSVAVAALVFWRPWRRARDGESSLEILQERFARGEIDADEYTRRREALEVGS